MTKNSRDILKNYFSIEINEVFPSKGNIAISLKDSSDTKECLPIPDVNADHFLDRRSQRSLRAFQFETLASILYKSSRVQEIAKNEFGFNKTLRPYPSAGGRHPLEILCITKDMHGIDDGAWYFDPYDVTLKKMNLPSEYLAATTKSTSDLIGNPSPVIIQTLGVINRTLTRYQNGYGFIWRDTGNLLSTISFAAKIHKIESCQLGFSKEFNYGDLLGIKEQPIWITGGIALGAIEKKYDE